MPSQLPPIAVRVSALTLRERLLRGPAPEPASDADRARSDDALERWRRMLDQGGPGRFARRLRWDGLDEAAARGALAAPPAPGEAPDWASLLADACDAAGDEGRDPAQDPADPIPFEELLLPFVAAARRRLDRETGASEGVIAPGARRDVERALLRELSGAAEQTLSMEFAVARARGGTPSFSFGAPGDRAYRAFVGALRGARLEPLVARYPVLARLLAVRAMLWVGSTAELVARLRADAGALRERFGPGAEGPVASLRTGRGETHCGGRTVAALRFASGLEVMYKPRSLRIDAAFYGLLAWLGERGLSPDQRILGLLERDDYGWVEFVRHRPLESAAEARDYYERAGALLSVATLLGAGDLHGENLIAEGAYPVPIDLETIMGTAVEGIPEGAGADEVPLRRSPSVSNVLVTALLPFWQSGPNGTALEPGGFGAGPEAPRVERGWAYVNTDGMRREERTHPAAPTVNVPMLDGRAVCAEAHVDDLVRGFERCHAFIEAHRDELTAPGGPFERFRGQRVRVMMRNTRVYDSALRSSLHPTALRDGVDRSIQLERLRTSVLVNEKRLPYWPAFEAEQRDLDDLDFPYFWCFTDGTVLHDARGIPVGRFCSVSAYDAVRVRLGAMSAAERARDAALVRFSYAIADSSVAVSSGPASADGGAPPLDARAAVAEADAIARALESLVVRDGDGSAQWIGRDAADPEAPNALRPLSDRLFDGRPGVAVFLAALDRVAGTGHAALAAEALLPLRRTVREAARRDALAARLGIGGGLGMGGVVYSLAQIGRLTGDAAWTDDAVLAARALGPGAIAADGTLEVLGGSAGALLALLALHDLTGEAAVLDAARACGARLLGAVQADPATGLGAWRPDGGGFATGFAHGAGGIATALLRLAAATGSEAFAAAAEDGFRYEAHAAQAGERAVNRAHPAENADFSWAQTWCNGALGVAMGRASCGHPVPDDVVRGAADRELGAATDHPCCGHLGRAELLLVAGRPEHALALAGEVVGRARAGRSYRIAREIPDARMAPAFFQGVSGIGYQLLRLAHPDALPSVLAFR